jgi:hypothetical protein
VIAVTIHLLPGGNAERSKEIGSIFITNSMKGQNPNLYIATLIEDGAVLRQTERHVKHMHSDGVYVLLQKVLKELKPEMWDEYPRQPR